MEHTPFIGTGPSPDGIDIPLGLGNLLAQEPSAMETFGHLSRQQKAAMISHIKGAATGPEAENRVRDALEQLRNGGITI